ncbi:MAG: transcription elongation factor GreA [Deltaproteobacteria bacterium]|nr:transcription elongation factor GreA [Deltaproteobacteria bacterium]
MARIPMTAEGHAALKAELKQLTEVERHKISLEIGVAREHGDLRENAEYHAAKDRQGQVEARIRQLEGMLAEAEIVDSAQLGGDRVKFGARVTLEDLDSGKVSNYHLVGEEEADLKQGKVSINSPLARALINREVGDEVKVRAPGGVRTYEIVEINWQRSRI